MKLTANNLDEEIFLHLFTITRMAHKSIGLVCRQHDLSPVRLQTLIVISLGKQTMSELAEQLHIALPTATALVDKLVESKLVSRKENPNDRRVVQIHLTSLGTEALETAIKEKIEKSKFILSKLSNQDKENFLIILRKLVKES